MTQETMTSALRYRYLIFGILGLGYIVVYFHRLCPAVLAIDMMTDLNAGGTLIGVLGSAYFYPYALMQLPAGLLSDSWGARKSITVFLLLAFLGAWIMGAADSSLWAIAGRTLTGFGVSILFVPAMKVMSEWFDGKEFAVMSGFLIAIGGIGSLFSATPLAWLSSAIGWRISFMAVGGITLAIAGLVWLVVRDRPEDMGWPSLISRKSENTTTMGLWQGVSHVLAFPRFWPVAIWFFFDAGIFFALGGLWGGPFLMQVYHLDKTQAGDILSMLSFGMILGSPALSFLSNRVIRGRKPVLILSGALVSLMTLILYLKTDTLSHGCLFGLFFGMGIFASAVVAIGFTATKELFPATISGTAIGLVNLFPFLGGALLQPFIGFILEKEGAVNGVYSVTAYRSAMLVFFICALLAFAASFFVKETVVRSE